MRIIRKSGLLLLALTSITSLARANQRAYGFCTQGAQPIIVVGLNGTPQAHSSYPGCTVTVFISGTTNRATIFKDNLGTALGNPFTGDITTGYWQFYAANGRYDVLLNGAGIPNPGFTFGDILLADLGASGILPGGVPIQTQVNADGSHLGGTPCENFGNLTTGPENVDCDWHPKGPNPYTDAARFGVRGCDPNNIPCSLGMTGNITSASTTLTTSTASCPNQIVATGCFLNGDGIVVYGAGPTCTLSTPSISSVIPSVAILGTATGNSFGNLTIVPNVVTGPTASTTYNYQVVAVDFNGCVTPASTVVSTTVGQASLGATTVAITSHSRANDLTGVVTVTTSAAHGFPVGCTSIGTPFSCGMVMITGTSDDINFGGWFTVTSAVDTTHFTYMGGLVGPYGASLSATGGTAQWFNLNRINITSAITGAYEYCLYGRSGASLTWVTCGLPINVGAGFNDLFIDDYGPTMMANIIRPAWIPNTPPGAIQNDWLATTVVSGGATTTLTLANSASNTVTGATVRFDNSVNLLAAANAAILNLSNSGGTLFLGVNPATAVANYRVILNASVSLPSPLGIVVGGNAGVLWLNATLRIGPNTFINGNTFTPSQGIAPFMYDTGPIIYVHEAHPGIWFGPPGAAQVSMKNIQVQSADTNGTVAMVVDNPTPGTWERVEIDGDGGTGGYVDQGLVMRGGFMETFNKVAIRCSVSGNAIGGSATPCLYINGAGQTSIQDNSMGPRGYLYISGNVAGGATFEVHTGRQQGNIMPTFMFSSVGQSSIYDFENDTTFAPMVGNFGPVGGRLNLKGSGAGGNLNLVSGIPFASIDVQGSLGVVSSQLGQLGQNINVSSPGIASIANLSPTASGNPFTINVGSGPRYLGFYGTDVNHGIFWGVAPAAPTASAPQPGGSLTVGTAYSAVLAPVGFDGAVGSYSFKSNTCTPTTGNQTCNFTWSSPSQPGVAAWALYIFSTSGPSGGLANSVTFSVATTSFSLNSNAQISLSFVAGNAGISGQAYLNLNEFAAPQFRITNGTAGFSHVQTDATLTANRTVTWPDAVGTPNVTIYATNSATTAASIGTTPMVTAPASGAKYVFTLTAYQVGGGTSCTTNTTLQGFVNFTDAVTSTAQVPSLGAYSNATNSFTGNQIPVLAVNNGVTGVLAIQYMQVTINAKASTTVSYGTTYTAGTGCAPAPTYYVTPSLVQVQ